MKVLILTLFIICNLLLSAQEDNCIVDYDQYEVFHKYLMDFKLKKDVDNSSIIEEYKNICIGLRNLKTDSIISNKNLVGIYSFGFVSTVDKYRLGIRYSNGEFKYLDMEQPFEEIMGKINLFLQEECKEFTLKEKIKTIYEVADVLYYYHYGVGCEEVIISPK